MSAELAPELERHPVPRARPRSARARGVRAIGPATALAGVVWALVQPDRLTVLHPASMGFWRLLDEAPLFVVAAGLLFHRLVVRGLAEDIEEER